MCLIQNLHNLRRMRDMSTVPGETFSYEIEVQSNVVPFSLERVRLISCSRASILHEVCVLCSGIPIEFSVSIFCSCVT